MDLPIEIIEFILDFLSLDDLINCRQVNRKFRFCINKTKVDELVIESDKFNNQNYWLNSKKLIDHNKAIEFKLIKSHRSIFNLEVNLKYLFLYNAHKYFENLGLIINCLLNLNHLEIFVNGIIEDNNKFLKIELPNLTHCKIFDAHTCKIVLNSAKLKLLDSEVLYSTEVIFPLSITHLFTGNNYDGFFTGFKNVEFLYLRWSAFHELFSDPSKLDFVKEFPKLKSLFLIMKNDIYFKANNTNLKSIITFNVEQRVLRKNFDFKISYQGVRLVDIQKFTEIYSDNIRTSLHYQLQNFHLLADDLSFVTELNYTDLINLINLNHLELKSIQNRYYNISHVIVTEKVDDSASFIKYLKELKCLKILSLHNSQLDSNFYNLLGHCNLYRLHTLNLTEKIDLLNNFEFILNFKSLIAIELNQPIVELTYSQMKPFDQLEYLKNFSLIINSTNTIKVIKNQGNEENSYSILHIINKNEKNSKLKNLLISNHVIFSELITVLNHLIKVI